MINNKHFYDENKISFFKWQLEYVIDQIKMADNKINFLLTIYLALLGIVFLQIEKILSIFLNLKVNLEWKIVIGIICFLFFVCIMKFFNFFIYTVKPRTKLENSFKEEKNHKSVIFWEDIVDMGYENFKNATLENRYNDLEKQVFRNSIIAKIKFEKVTKAYKLLIPTLFLFMILFSLILLIGD